jgi:hypothetical protein
MDDPFLFTSPVKELKSNVSKGVGGVYKESDFERSG